MSLTEDSWSEVIYFLGTSFDDYHNIFQYDWDFSDLYYHLLEEEGMFNGHKVWMWGATEPQYIDEHLVYIPTVFVAVCKSSPFEDIILTSVQAEEESILPLKKLKMRWSILEDRKGLYSLNCTQRIPALKRLSEVDKLRWEYALPYQVYAHNFEFKPQDSFQCSYEIDENTHSFNHFVGDEEISEEELYDIAKDTLKEAKVEVNEENMEIILEAINKGTVAHNERNQSNYEAQVEYFTNQGEKRRSDLEDMYVVKFYPTLEKPEEEEEFYPEIEEFKNSFVNRFHGHCDMIFDPNAVEEDSDEE
ncbi:hypothetical protein PCE1_001810 [Barthelona sp. PCE]